MSAGNIEAGGTGKTPLTIEIAKIIKEIKSKISIVCYAADRKNPDESLVILKSVGEALVYHGKNRRKLVDYAAKSNPEVIIIDDGFQYFDIKNKVDVVLLDPEIPLNLLIPAGRMRFPASFLKYADAIVIRETKKNKKSYKKFVKRIEKYHKPIFFARYQMLHLVDLSGSEVSLSILRNKRAIAFCGIAKPTGFIEMIFQTGVREIYAVWYPDHFIYSQSDVDELEKLFYRLKPEVVITTEKDMVKLKKFQIGITVYGLVVRLAVEPYEEFKTYLVSKIFPEYNHFQEI